MKESAHIYMKDRCIVLTRSPPIRAITLGVSSSGIAKATLGRASPPAIPPTMAATVAKDSLRETSALDFELGPENA